MTLNFDRIDAIASRTSYQRESAQVAAKGVLRELLSEVPEYRWTYEPSQVVKLSTALLAEIVREAVRRPEDTSILGPAAKRLASTWEGLARTQESTSRHTALLNAAAAYELAGMQANGIALARRLLPSRNPSAELVGRFLTRQFILLRVQARRLVQEPPDIEDRPPHAVLEALADGATASALDAAAELLLSGTSVLEETLGLLRGAAGLWGELGRIHEANAVSTIGALLPVMAARSTWRVLDGFVEDPRWHRYLQLLARGTDQDLLNGSGVVELWPSQRGAIEAGLLGGTSNLVLRMPTSSGKTRASELAVVAELLSHPEAKCVYLAPYRALVTEVEESYSRVFPDLGFRVVSSTGAFEADELDVTAVSQADVLVVTPERLDLIIRAEPDFGANVRLVVVDEAHVVGDPGRGVKLDFLLTRLKRRFPNARVIALSAVVPDRTLEDFSEWLNRGGDPANVAETDWRPTTLRHAAFEWNGRTGILRYERTADAPTLAEFVPGLVRVEDLGYVNPRTGYRNRAYFPDGKTKAQTAASLAFALAPMGPLLVFCSTKRNVDAVAQAILRRYELATLRGETEPRLPATHTLRSLAVAEEWLGAEHQVCHLLRLGAAVHHGDLPDPVRKAVEDDVRARRIAVLIATNTLAQGVNLPLRTVIFHSTARYDETRNRMQRIPARDYWNIAGRAGRARQETDGLVIHIVHSPSDRGDFDFYKQRRDNVEPVRSAVLGLLVALAQDQITPEAAAAGLDPELLALMVEEGADEDALERIHEIALDSLGAVQARGASQYLESLRGLVDWTTRSILATAPDPLVRSIYARTGLASESCRSLHSRIAEMLPTLQRLLESAGPADVDQLIEVVLEAISDVPELQAAEFGADPVAVARLWLSGARLDEMRAELGESAGSPEDLATFLEDYCGYRASWGASAFLRLAAATAGLAEDEISPFAKFLPSMLRFGVSSPAAAWAMTLGIPSRRTAIEIATRYTRSSEGISPAGLREWLSQFEFSELPTLDVPNGLLEETGLAILRAGVSGRLEEFQGLDSVLPLRTPLLLGVGEAIDLDWHLEHGSSLSLERDYDSVLDRNLIVVKAADSTVGRLPRPISQLLAPDIDSGAELGITVERDGDGFAVTVVRSDQAS
jgi:superfamily II DNA/RNA helicase